MGESTYILNGVKLGICLYISGELFVKALRY